MKPFRTHRGTLIPLDRIDVDTDQIIPKQFLKRVKRTGFGDFLFFNWRYRPDGEPVDTFVLNDPAYRDGSILLGRRNFGCGSSREHAVWAIKDYGIRAILAPSFADIFYNNAFKNGLLPVRLPSGVISDLFDLADADPDAEVTVDLETCRVHFDEQSVSFEIEPFRREALLQGLDEISLTLQHQEAIETYESSHPTTIDIDAVMER